mmetsp:Transcript_23308/g.88399  ORF Transcript_23308/g.88399 Transcript_23308/m.88399 type:complete len:491 (-) Transcript_23308:957-2429(-)
MQQLPERQEDADEQLLEHRVLKDLVARVDEQLDVLCRLLHGLAEGGAELHAAEPLAHEGHVAHRHDVLLRHVHLRDLVHRLGRCCSQRGGARQRHQHLLNSLQPARDVVEVHVGQLAAELLKAQRLERVDRDADGLLLLRVANERDLRDLGLGCSCACGRGLLLDRSEHFAQVREELLQHLPVVPKPSRVLPNRALDVFQRLPVDLRHAVRGRQLLLLLLLLGNVPGGVALRPQVRRAAAQRKEKCPVAQLVALADGQRKAADGHDARLPLGLSAPAAVGREDADEEGFLRALAQLAKPHRPAEHAQRHEPGSAPALVALLAELGQAADEEQLGCHFRPEASRAQAAEEAKSERAGAHQPEQVLGAERYCLHAAPGGVFKHLHQPGLPHAAARRQRRRGPVCAGRRAGGARVSVARFRAQRGRCGAAGPRRACVRRSACEQGVGEQLPNGGGAPSHGTQAHSGGGLSGAKAPSAASRDAVASRRPAAGQR